MTECTLAEGMEHLENTFVIEKGDPWSDADFAAYTAETGLTIPAQLEEVLRIHGALLAEWDDNMEGTPWFLAEFEDGTITKNEALSLVASRENMESSHRMFRLDTVWPDRFPLDMVFFGTANNNYLYLLMNGKDATDNAVYCWFMASDPFGTGNNTMGLGRVADSLFEFFCNLRLDADI